MKRSTGIPSTARAACRWRLGESHCGESVQHHRLLAGAGWGSDAGGGVGCASANALGSRDTAYTFHIPLAQFCVEPSKERRPAVPILSEIMKAVGLKRHKQLLPPGAPSYAIQTVSANKNLSLAFPDEDFPVVIITGRAGTGKSTLVRELARTSDRRQVVLAPTGVAALNVGGQTIHSFFRETLHKSQPCTLLG
jgi:hypothetical protein